MADIKELKAEVFDLLRQMEYHQQEAENYRQQVQAKSKEIAELEEAGSQVTLDNSEKAKK